MDTSTSKERSVNATGSTKDRAGDNDKVLHEHGQATSKSGDAVGADIYSKTNGIRLLDVASLSKRGYCNEDRIVVDTDENLHLFAVIDGHNSARAANFLVENLSKTLTEVYDNGFDHAKLCEAMEELDRMFCALDTPPWNIGGACVLVVLMYVDPNTDAPQKVVLNIGDCRAIIREAPESIAGKNEAEDEPSPAASVVALSEDHCASNEKEMARALRSGAKILGNRIAGILQPFRVIGDADLKGPDKKDWVIPTPEIHQSELLVGRSILVIASDGVWTVLDNDCVMKLAFKEIGANGSAKSAAEAIVGEAVKKHSKDDISVIVVSV
ncbi:Protein phosphatase 2C [Phytophthora infestans]|uniref:Protein phosphatase 2C n=1 Tax=Phytophthora infestans TaxID=4787 RepID=A0A8S9TL48_PHYIN|nr:Protein phosphatase 2C [Phytophthora infestans]